MVPLAPLQLVKSPQQPLSCGGLHCLLATAVTYTIDILYGQLVFKALIKARHCTSGPWIVFGLFPFVLSVVFRAISIRGDYLGELSIHSKLLSKKEIAGTCTDRWCCPPLPKSCVVVYVERNVVRLSSINDSQCHLACSKLTLSYETRWVVDGGCGHMSVGLEITHTVRGGQVTDGECVITRWPSESGVRLQWEN